MKTLRTQLPAGEIIQIRSTACHYDPYAPNLIVSVQTANGIQEIKLSGNGIRAIKRNADGTMVVIQNANDAKDLLILVEAENLSMDDEFMQHAPTSKNVLFIKDLIVQAIQSGVKNFYHYNCDPSFANDYCTDIHFKPGEKPAIKASKTLSWWADMAKKHCPERNSRLGTKLEYGAFLGVLIKKLIERGDTVEEAWNAICHDSHKIGYFHFEIEDFYEAGFAPTGSHPVCGINDLANTTKILLDDEGFWSASGYVYDKRCGKGKIASISFLGTETENKDKVYSQNMLGWIVLS